MEPSPKDKYSFFSIALAIGIKPLKKKLKFQSELKIKKYCNNYSITPEGIKVLKYNQKIHPFKIDKLINHIKSNKKSNPKIIERNTMYLGKNQKILLKTLYNEKPMFVGGIRVLTAINISSIEFSLRKLFDRGFVERKKDINLASTQKNRKYFKYNMTEKGINLLELLGSQDHKKAKKKIKI